MAGVNLKDIGFTCSGSCDYLSGGPFVFVQNLEAAGAWPPISESHVEMDGAWALYEAWVRLQEGDIDLALVFGSGKCSPSDPYTLYPSQLDPYYLEPIGLDPVSIAGLQAQALIDAGKATERDFAEVAARSRRAAESNPLAQVSGSADVDALLAEPYVRQPLRRHDLPPITDGACSVILATADKARELSKNPIWIRGIDHRLEPHQPGMRDLTVSTSTATAGRIAGVDKARAFMITHFIIIAGFLTAGISSLLFAMHSIEPFAWMTLVGLGLYIGYIPFNCILFDRMIATFRTVGNVGFLMYLADSFGYLASVGVILAKTVFTVNAKWTELYSRGVILLSIVGVVLTVAAAIYFARKFKKENPNAALSRD